MNILGDAGRPAAVKQFEWLQLLSILIALLEFALSPMETFEMVGGLAILPIFVLVILRASRYRSNFAKWLLFVLFVLGSLLLPLAWLLPEEAGAVPSGWELASFALQTLLQAASFVLVFTKPARVWFSQGKAAKAVSI